MELYRIFSLGAQFGYPIIIFYIIGVIGFVLIFFRPKWAFAFVVFGLSARNFHAAVYTRTPLFGPYLNLNDLLLWIALLAMVMICLRKKKFYLPKVLLYIFILLIVGEAQTILQYSFERDVLRALWGTMIFPIMFLVASNFVKTEKDANIFYWSLFCGATLAALQHLFALSHTKYYINIHTIRTISYIYSGGIHILIAYIFLHYKIISFHKRITFYLCLVVIIASYLLSFTRGLYLVSIAVILTFPFVIKAKEIAKAKFLKFAIGFIVMLLIINLLYPKLNLLNVIVERFESAIHRESLSIAYKSRWLGMEKELNLWLYQSPIIIGVGSSYSPEIENLHIGRVARELGALNHVGFSAYLAHFGLLGLLLYGFILPLKTINVAKSIYNKKNNNSIAIKKITFIGISVSLYYLFGLLTSIHLLGSWSHIAGLIYGSIWGIYQYDSNNQVYENEKIA